ncbi:hypothetical protein CGZ80_13610 [Rhodopirellula sp. MGV]|nr:hypothetical protein CGZ80_13610 [Rhodopirellula sp. MGV]PNY35796.1 SGNH/GDSL hydrolase family protein [Rhodopirellula baltica]
MRCMPYASLIAILFCTFGVSICHAAPVKIMSLGDSITAGYNGSPETELRGSYRQELGTLLSQIGIDFDFVGEFQRGAGDNDHQGIGGYSIERMTAEYGPAVNLYQADYTLVLAGTNNHFAEPNREYYEETYRDLLQMVRDNAPDTSIIIATVPRFGYDRAPETSYWTESWVNERNDVRFPMMNQAIYDVAAEMGNITVVDYYSELDPTTDLISDGVHPNLYGHQKLANLFFGELSSQISAIPEPSIVFPMLAFGVMSTIRRRKRSAQA